MKKTRSEQPKFQLDLRKHWQKHLMLLPMVVLLFIFSYIPMVGIVMAFQNYVPSKGYFGSQWAGWQWFKYMFSMQNFKQVVWNTLSLSILKLVTGIGCSVLFALMLNEMLWSFSMTFINQRYSMCGAGVLAALNITSVINMLANVVTINLGSTTAIIIGQMLGAGKDKKLIRDESRRLIFLMLIGGTVFGLLLAAIAPLFPRIYNTTAQIRAMATGMILILALFKPVMGMVHSCYSIIRAGGKTFLTFINAFKMFDQNLALTAGAPEGKTTLPALDIFRTFYGRVGAQGVGQAKAVIFFLVVALFSSVQFIKRKERG